MSERLYHYSLIRYVPRPVAEEFVNVGVVAVSDSGDEAAVEFTDDWTRARALGGRDEDVLMLRRLARAWTDEDYDSAALSWSQRRGRRGSATQSSLRELGEQSAVQPPASRPGFKR
jgi:hypothetical protein